MKGLGIALLILAACVQNKSYFAGPRPKPAAPTARPFHAPPTVSLVNPMQSGPMYRVAVAADITRDVIPTDDLAIVVSVDDHEVGRYPVVGRFQHSPTRIKQEIELPLGDYEIDLEYQGTRYAGMPFRLAEVPVWGGRRALQLRAHPGTRISVREQKLWVGRWWANDGPAAAWIVEWVREGQVVTTTSGAEARGIPPRAQSVVGGAVATFRDTRTVQNTIWTYGEEYPLPPVVLQQPGVWAARVVHGASSPVAVVFTVLPGGKLAEASPRRIAAVGWEESWTKRLEQRALSVTEVERLTAKLPRTGGTQPFDELDARYNGPEAPIRLSTSAVRALFRNKQLAESWYEFLTLNTHTVYAQPASTAKSKADTKRTKLRALRPQIEQLIKAHGGPWKSDEFPRS